MARRFDLNRSEVYHADTPLPGAVAGVARWQRKNWELRVIVRGDCVGLSFRKQDKPNVHLTDLSEFTPNEWSAEYASLDATSLRNRFDRTMSQGSWGRMFQFSADLKPIDAATPPPRYGAAVCLRADGKGCWMSSPDPNAPQFALGAAHFRHGLSAFQLLTWPSARLISHLQTGVAAADDDIGFAHRLLLLRQPQVVLRAYRFARGDSAQWENILSATLRANWIWPPEIQKIRWLAMVEQTYQGRVTQQAFHRCYFEQATNFHYDSLPQYGALEEQLTRAQNYFAPWIDFEFCGRHEQLAQLMSRPHRRHMEIEIGAPTAHQQLEAMLTLREFWAGVVNQ